MGWIKRNLRRNHYRRTSDVLALPIGARSRNAVDRLAGAALFPEC